MIPLIEKAMARRLPLRPFTNALRLVNGGGDGLDGLILEQYNEHFLAQVYKPEWLHQMPAVLTLIEKNFKPAYFIVKDRSQSASSEAKDISSQILIKGPSKTRVLEHGIQFDVDLNDGLNTGLFLDMRANRYQVGQLCRGKKVLNCFAYTCSFGVHAKFHQASEVVNVDLSRPYLNRGKANYALNNLTENKGEFLCFDAVEFLSKAVKKDNRFDAIIIDPPSFARGDKKTFQVKRDLPKLLSDACKVLNPGGVLCVATNFNGLKHSDLEGMLKLAAKERTIKSKERIGQDEDFVGTNTFKESYLAGLIAWFL